MPSDRERYSDAIERCRTMAPATSNAGCQHLWTTVADSYRCLLDNEARTEADARERAKRLDAINSGDPNRNHEIAHGD